MDEYLSDAQIKDILKISQPTLWRWRRDGFFPKVIKIGKNTNRTRVSDFKAWQRDRELKSLLTN